MSAPGAESEAAPPPGGGRLRASVAAATARSGASGGRDTLAVWRPARAPEVEAEDRCAQNMRIGRTLNSWVEGLLVVPAIETVPGENVHMVAVDASDEVA